MPSLEVEAMVHGYHVYQDIWDAVIHEELVCVSDPDNLGILLPLLLLSIGKEPSCHAIAGVQSEVHIKIFAEIISQMVLISRNLQN